MLCFRCNPRLTFRVMQRTRVKICGIMTPDAAVWAATAGADAIGLVFYPPGRRNVTPQTAQGIIAVLPPFVTPVGLFVDADPDTILRTAREIGLRHVQLHGNEPPADVAALAAQRLRPIKAIAVRPESLDEDLAPWRNLAAAHPGALGGIILETASTAAPGGTGIPNDWDAIRTAQDRGAFDGLPPIIAAGGLNPDNVADVIRTIRPYAVDVSSGVETNGQKDPNRITAFIGAVHRADHDR